MADSTTKIGIEVDVNGVDKTINSMKDLKDAIKDAKNEQIKAAEQFGLGSKEYDQASKRVSSLKDKVDDLSDSTKSLQGSGIERASAGFNQLGEGLRNLDFDKVKVGLTAMKTALAAVGIGLIVQAVQYLVENFDELSKGSGALATTLRALGEVFETVKNFITDLVGATDEASRALDKMGEDVVNNATKSKDALANQTAEYDRQIAVAKASGKSAVDLEIAKQEAIIETNKALVQQTIAYVRAGGVLDDEKKKLLTEQLNAIKNAKTAEAIIDIQDKKESLDRHKKYLEDKDKLGEANYQRFKAQQEAQRLAEKAEQDTYDELKRIDEFEKGKLDQEAYNAGAAEANALNESLLDQAAKDKRDKEAADRIAKEKETQAAMTAAAFDASNRTLQAGQALSDAYFAYKRRNLQKGSAEELAAAKKQFQINKALAITTATIQGVQGVLAAFSSGAAVPVVGAILGPAYAVLAGIVAAANIAKIASTKFDEGGSGGGASGGTASAGPPPSVPVPAPPSIDTAQNNTQGGTQFDKNGNPIRNQQPVVQVKATVGVDEITSKSNRVDVLEKQSTF